MEQEKTEVILSGRGGQGLLLAGLILGDAAAISEGLYAIQTESYAPLARGGASSSEVIISKRPIDYPRVRAADILVVLSQEAFDSSISRLKPGGLVIVDSDSVRVNKRDRIIAIPLSTIAKEKTGKTFTLSIVSLGVAAAITGIVSLSSLLTSINHRAPRGTEEINRRAAEAGFSEGERCSVPLLETGFHVGIQ